MFDMDLEEFTLVLAIKDGVFEQCNLKHIHHRSEFKKKYPCVVSIGMGWHDVPNIYLKCTRGELESLLKDPDFYKILTGNEGVDIEALKDIKVLRYTYSSRDLIEWYEFAEDKIKEFRDFMKNVNEAFRELYRVKDSMPWLIGEKMRKYGLEDALTLYFDIENRICYNNWYCSKRREEFIEKYGAWKTYLWTKALFAVDLINDFNTHYSISCR